MVCRVWSLPRVFYSVFIKGGELTLQDAAVILVTAHCVVKLWQVNAHWILLCRGVGCLPCSVLYGSCSVAHPAWPNVSFWCSITELARDKQGSSLSMHGSGRDALRACRLQGNGNRGISDAVTVFPEVMMNEWFCVLLTSAPPLRFCCNLRMCRNVLRSTPPSSLTSSMFGRISTTCEPEIRCDWQCICFNH